MVFTHYTPTSRRSFIRAIGRLLFACLAMVLAVAGGARAGTVPTTDPANPSIVPPGIIEASFSPATFTVHARETPLSKGANEPPAVDDKSPIKFEELLDEGEPAFDKATAERYLREVLPLIEKAAGRRFKKRPRLRLAGRDEVGAALARDILPQLRNLMPDRSEDDLAKLAAKQAANIAPVLLGKYGFKDRVLFLLPRNVEPLLRLARIEGEYRPGLVKLIIAHELVHALQDEAVDLAQMLAGMKSQEELLAFNATIEGFAVFVQDEVGARLGLTEEVIQFSRLFTAGVVKFDDPAFELMNRAMAAQFEQIYLGGRRFIAHHHAQGGLARVWEIIRHPPVRTAMIKHPETWSSTRCERPDYAWVLRGLERWFGDDRWQVDNIEIGQMGLQSAYAGLRETERDRLLAQVEHAQALVARSPEQSRLGNVTLIVLRDAAIGREYIDAVEAMANRNFAQLNDSRKLQVTDVNATDAPQFVASIARRVEFTLMPLGEPKMHNVIWRIVRGSLLIEITMCNLDLPADAVEALATLVWRRHGALTREPAARGTGRCQDAAE